MDLEATANAAVLQAAIDLQNALIADYRKEVERLQRRLSEIEAAEPPSSGEAELKLSQMADCRFITSAA